MSLSRREIIKLNFNAMLSVMRYSNKESSFESMAHGRLLNSYRR
jgi:hypothetical protein